MWSWANESVNQECSVEVLQVKSMGEEHNIPKMYEGAWECSEEEAWDMAAVAAFCLEAVGAVGRPHETGIYFFLFYGSIVGPVGLVDDEPFRLPTFHETEPVRQIDPANQYHRKHQD